MIATRFGIFSMRSLQQGTRMRWIRTSRASMRWRTGLHLARTHMWRRGDAVGDGVAVPGKPTASPTITQARQILGTYILRSNQSGGGSHVANAGFMVSASARGRGLGRAMAEHCLSEARRFGFRAMQFNYVISTNTAAIRLWRDLGFEIVGTLASAFRHPDNGYVDVFVMYRSLL